MPGSSIVLNGTIGFPSNRQILAMNGNYFVATNPTPGTAIAYALKTGFSATANGLFSISNGNQAGGANIILDRLRLTQTATAPTGTLYMGYEVYTETGTVAISTAAAAVTPQNVNASKSSLSAATVTFFSAGAGTVPAAVGTRRLVDCGKVPTGVTVLGDTFVWDFGGDAAVSGKAGLTAARATDLAMIVTNASPVIVAPGTSAYMNLWWVTAAANTPSFEFQLGWAEI